MILKRTKKGFSFIEVMVATAILSAGIVAIFQSFFLSMNYLNHLTYRIHALSLIENQIVRIKTQIKPDIIFTHFENDTNIDHKITFNAVMAASRPMLNETVKEIYSFEVLSSTEWNFPLSFSPDTFFDINETLSIKTDAIKTFLLPSTFTFFSSSNVFLSICSVSRNPSPGVSFAGYFFCIVS